MKRVFSFFIVTFALAACGSGLEYPAAIATQSPPALVQVSPTSAAPGDTVTLYGLGFSTRAEANVLLLGDSEITATTYAVNEDTSIEAPELLTFVLPDDVAAEAYPLSLFVSYEDGNGVATSSKITLTVTP